MDFVPSESNCVLFHVHVGFSATYGNVLKVIKCERWFKIFTVPAIMTCLTGLEVEFDVDALKSGV